MLPHRCVSLASIVGALALSACETAPSPPPQPPAYVVTLQQQCAQGSTEACGLLMQRDQARQLAAAQILSAPRTNTGFDMADSYARGRAMSVMMQ